MVHVNVHKLEPFSEELDFVMDLTKPQNIAQERWRLLRDALLKKKFSEASPCSISIHNSLGIFAVKPCMHDDSDVETWLKYVIKDRASESVQIKVPSFNFSMEEYRAPDNTGNIRIWASEQALAHFVIRNLTLFSNASVIELGGGYSCLAGVLLAKYGCLNKIVLSDGNEKCVKNIQDIACRNNLNKAEVLKLRWDDDALLSHHSSSFSYVLVADCTFRDCSRMSLVNAIHILLRHNGECIMFSPQRGSSLADFIKKAQCVFGHDHVEVTEKYDGDIWNRHLVKSQCSSYKFDIHYPLLVLIRK